MRMAYYIIYCIKIKTFKNLSFCKFIDSYTLFIYLTKYVVMDYLLSYGGLVTAEISKMKVRRTT